MIVLEIVSTLVQIGFQITAAYVALIGLQSWMIQLKGRTEYELAKNVIAGAYRIRDEIKRCQDPFVRPYEWAECPSKERETAAQQLAMQNWFAYERRYEKVEEAMISWQPHTVEAEALFGEEARQIIDSLEGCCKTLRSAIAIYHNSLYLGQENSGDKVYKNIIFGISSKSDSYMPAADSDDDKFQEELDVSIKKIRSYFSPHITAKIFTFNPLQSIRRLKS